MLTVFFLKQSGVVRGNAHVERYIEHALNRVDAARVVGFDLVKEARNVKVSAAADEAEIYQRYREYIVRRIQSLKPDIFLVLNGYALEAQFPGFFAQIKSLGVTMVAWHADDPYYVDLQEPIAGCFDHIFTVDSSTLELWRTRAPHAAYLPFAFAPESIDGIWTGHSCERFASDVCFVGAPFARSRRVGVIDEHAALLASLATRIMGATPIDTWQHSLRNYALLRDSIDDSFVEPADAVRYFSAARINLNIHKESSGHAWDRNRRGIAARSPNERLFAIAGTGAFQLVDNSRPDLDTLFPEDAVATFDPGVRESFSEQVGYFLTHESHRSAIAARLRELVMAEHTYDARIEALFRAL